jgi:nicotinate-nucleotide--dimethylbenzimidazole phosphoribosyltransferase
MVYNFMRGGAGVNVLARHVGAEVVVVDMGVASSLKRDLKVIQKKIGYGTKNMVKGPSMSRGEAEKSIEAGIEVFEDVGRGADIIGIGDMGIGNTTSSSAILAALTGEAVEKVTGRGTGINDEMLKRKIEVVKRALEVNMPNPEDPLDVLAKVGGFEIGGLAGVVLAGASSKIPVVIDGFISGAAALIAIRLESKVREYLFASHCSAEIGHRVMLQWMGLEPLLDLNLRLGEGTGAALGISLVEAGCKILNEMASFDEAGVSGELT